MKPTLLVMFVGGTPAMRSHTLATKMSLSMAGAPGNVPVSAPVPGAERWNAMRVLSGDQVAELPPVVRNCTLLPSALIKNRSTRLGGAARRTVPSAVEDDSSFTVGRKCGERVIDRDVREAHRIG